MAEGGCFEGPACYQITGCKVCVKAVVALFERAAAQISPLGEKVITEV